MVQMRNEFLDSAGFINKNQAEYSILTDLYNACSNKCFLFQLKNLDGIKNFYTDVVKYINVNYKSFELMKFVLNEEGIISHEILNNMAEVIKDAEAYLAEYMSIEGEEACSDKFKNHYKMTYCDNILDLQYAN